MRQYHTPDGLQSVIILAYLPDTDNRVTGRQDFFSFSLLESKQMSEQTNPDTPPVKTRPDAIVDWKLYLKHNVAHADAENAAFFASDANRGHYVSQLLIHEHLVIP